MFYLNSTLNIGILPVLVFQLEETDFYGVLLLNKKEQLLDGIQIKHLYPNSRDAIASKIYFSPPTFFVGSSDYEPENKLNRFCILKTLFFLAVLYIPLVISA